MSFEYDDDPLRGEGMPKGNKRAGFIGLMVAKARRPRGLQRGPTSYDPNARPKNTPANFDLTEIGNPSKDLQRRFGNRRIAKEKVGRKKKSVVEKSAKGRFTKEERDELKRLADDGNQAAKDKLEAIQAAERARKSKQLGKEVKKRQPKQKKETQADRFAREMGTRENVAEVRIPTVDAPQVQPRARQEAQDPTLAEEEREKVNAYMRRFDINTISEESWRRLPRKERQEYIEDAERFSGRGKGGALVKRSYETEEQFKEREARTAEQTERRKQVPTVSYANFFAPNTIAGKALKASPQQRRVDSLGAKLTEIAYYKDPQVKAAFEKARKEIDSPFNAIVKGLMVVGDLGRKAMDVLPIPAVGKIVAKLYDATAGDREEAMAQSDRFKSKVEQKEAQRDAVLASEAQVLKDYAEAKNDLETEKQRRYQAYLDEDKKLKGGRKPTDNQFLQLVKTSYQPTPPPQLEGFQLVVNTPTVDAFVDEATKSVMLTLRGTVPTDKKDLIADASIPLNRLSRSERYIQDKAVVEQILQRYPPDQYEIYLTGHSLGGAIVNQLKRDYPFLKDAQTYNAAFQPYDLLRQQSGQIKRKYVSTDPLYKLGGRLFQNVTVVPPKSKSMPLGTIGALYDAYQGHALANFEGSGKGGMYSPLAKMMMKKNTAVGTMAREREESLTDLFDRYQAVRQRRDATYGEEQRAELERDMAELQGQMRQIGEGATAKIKKAVDEFLKAAEEYERKEAAQKQGKGKVKGKVVTMPIKEFKEEHKRLVKALTPAAKELKAQQKEVKSYGLGKPMKKLVDASGKVHRGAYHIMKDGSVHSGKTHTKRSKPLFVKE